MVFGYESDAVMSTCSCDRVMYSWGDFFFFFQAEDGIRDSP